MLMPITRPLCQTGSLCPSICLFYTAPGRSSTYTPHGSTGDRIAERQRRLRRTAGPLCGCNFMRTCRTSITVLIDQDANKRNHKNR